MDFTSVASVPKERLLLFSRQAHSLWEYFSQCAAKRSGPMSVSAGHLVSPTIDVRKRTLFMACVAHALHDGYTDLTYVMLPVWQADFGLSFTTLAALRGVYVGAMAALQLPAGRLAQRWGGRTILVIGTAIAAMGYAFAGTAGGFVGVCAALAIAGCGSSTQHPIASGMVSRAYGKQGRGPLGVYNFAGDLGKSALPAAISLLLVFMPWRDALWVVSGIGLAVAAAIALCMPSGGVATVNAPRGSHSAARGGFALLLCVGILDSAVRMGFLTYLPLLLKAKGASLQTVGLALALVFIGGAGGKFICGWLGARVGVLGAVIGTEAGTAALILAVLVSPIAACLALLPLLGIMLNGTSSVLYGTVPELTAAERTERAFALFYTGTIGSGAVAPIIYGMLGDRLGIDEALIATAVTALAICPLAFALASRLARAPSMGD
jgi:FSR family fosmidomycin resistance protein-like MFS transporter